MGIKERRDRERKELKRAILMAAREIAAGEGWQAVTIRRVAERIEYSPPTIYEHFASKEAMLYELTREGFRMLLAAIEAATAQAEPPGRLLGIARSYWEFAWAYPELYQVMHGLGGVPFCYDMEGEKTGVPAEAQAVFEATARAVQALPGMAQASPDELDDLVHLLWATLHGLVGLSMAGRIEREEQGRRLVDRAVRDFLAARGAGVTPEDNVESLTATRIS